MDSIDISRLREDLENEAMGAFYGGGFGGALIEAEDIERMTDEEVFNYLVPGEEGKNSKTTNFLKKGEMR